MLPDWHNATRLPRTRELWWRGIPARARPEVWKRAIGNDLGLTPTTYEKALARAKTVEGAMSGNPASSSSSHVPSNGLFAKETAWLRAIRRDALTTLPRLHLFQPGQPLHAPLIDLLAAHAHYRADVGYAFGTALPAALLVLTMPSAADAFVALANLLNRPLPLAFLTGERAGMERTYELVGRLLKVKRPRLHARLFGSVSEGGLGLGMGEVLEPMVRTLFLNGCCAEPGRPARRGSVSSNAGSAAPAVPSSSSGSVSLALAQRLWDVLVFDGDAAIIRACVGVLAAEESALYGGREEVLGLLGWNARVGLGVGGGVVVASGTADSGEEREVEIVEGIMGVVRGVGKEG